MHFWLGGAAFYLPNTFRDSGNTPPMSKQQHRNVLSYWGRLILRMFPSMCIVECACLFSSIRGGVKHVMVWWRVAVL